MTEVCCAIHVPRVALLSSFFKRSTSVLSKDFVEDAVKILVTRFIPLNPTDLEGWMEDPEEWVNTEEKENDQWEYELRVGVSLLPFRTSV